MTSFSPAQFLPWTLICAIFFILGKAEPRRVAVIAASFNLIYFAAVLMMSRLYPNEVLIDFLTLPFLIITVCVTFLAVSCVPASFPRAREYLVLLLVLSWGGLGVFLASTISGFLFYFGITLLPSFALIGFWGGHNRQQAAFQATITHVVAWGIIALGVLGLVATLPGVQRVFDFTEWRLALMLNPPNLHAQIFIWGPIFFLGFGLLVPFVPLHSWLTTSLSAAPTAYSILQAGSVRWVGVYGLLRVVGFLSPEGWHAAQPALLLLTIITLFFAGAASLAQKELPGALGLVLVSQNGFLLLGLVSHLTSGVQGLLLLVVGQGLSSALLFGLAGEVVRRSGENRLKEMGGLAHTAPCLTLFFALSLLASMGMPGFLNFAGLWLIMTSATVAFLPPFLLLSLLGWMLQIAALGRVAQCLFWGRPRQPVRDMQGIEEWAAYALLLALSLALGLVPEGLLYWIEPTVREVLP